MNNYASMVVSKLECNALSFPYRVSPRGNDGAFPPKFIKVKLI